MPSHLPSPRPSRRRAGGVLAAVLLSAAVVVTSAPSGAYAITGSGLVTSTVGALARLTVGGPVTSGGVVCSGVLVAPRLVLTAEACFATGTGKDPQPTTGWPVTAGFTAAATARSSTAVGIRYDHGRGLAVVALARTPVGITPVPVASTTLAGGDAVRVAGYGRTGTDWISDTPHEVALTVDTVATGTATVTGDGSFCPGDVGAPVLRTAGTGVELVGIATGAGRKGCLGDDSTDGTGSLAVTTDLGTRFDADPLGRSVLTPGDNGNAAAAAAAFGSAVATGDFDKNGYLDVAVGAPKDQPAGAASGSVTIYPGSAAGLGAGRRLRQTDMGAADEAGDGFGTALASGDFNKDGYADLAVGLPTEALGTVKAGIISLYYGSASGLTTAVGKAESDLGSFSNEEGDRFGAALAAGDFNNDGYGDLAVGAPGEAQAGETVRSGSVFVLKGSASGLVFGWVLEQTQFDDNHNEAGDEFGAALAAGNVTGSVHTDLVIGAPGEAPGSDPAGGAIYVMPGASGGRGAGFTRNQKGNGGSNEDGDLFGAALAVGNLDHDGYADIVVGSPGESPGSDPKSGSVTVFPGQAQGVGTGLPFVESAFVAGAAGDRFGAAVAVGDTDGDGRADVLIGAPGRANGPAFRAGATYLFRGQARSSTVTSPIQATGPIRQAAAFGTDETGDAFGAGLALADLTKDGKADAIIGAPGEAIPGEPAAGSASVLTAVAALAGGTASAPQAASPGAGPSIVEDYTHPGAAGLEASRGIKLLKGDGHIRLADCGADPDNPPGNLILVQTSAAGSPAQTNFCFSATGSSGLLRMELDSVYFIRGEASRTVDAKVEVHDDTPVTETEQVTPGEWQPIGVGQGRGDATLLELRFS